MPKREIIVTGDGSHTILIPEEGLTYHSIHGAIQESMHVFINAGLRPILEQGRGPLRIFEMGFGTGLNAFLSFMESKRYCREIFYYGLDAFPLPVSISHHLNYAEKLMVDPQIFERMHACPWNLEISMGKWFKLNKSDRSILDPLPLDKFDLAYFDAFAPDVQPELWTKEVFEKLFDCLEPGASLVTYSAKGEIRRALEQAGFDVKKMPGAPGKREMTKATKIINT